MPEVSLKWGSRSILYEEIKEDRWQENHLSSLELRHELSTSLLYIQRLPIFLKNCQIEDKSHHLCKDLLGDPNLIPDIRSWELKKGSDRLFAP